MVTITVTDQNEPPQAKNDTLYVTQGSFARYIQNGIPLCSLSVSDEDASDASKIFEYTLVDGNAGGYFSLDEAQGIISPALTPGTGDYPLRVKVTDAGGLSDTATVLFRIISDTFLDSRNNQTYKRVSIGRQVWMGENLNYKTDSSWCLHDTASNCDTYGRLYQWHAAMAIDAIYDSTLWGGSDVNHQGVCPSGWHLPNDGECYVLSGYVDANNGDENIGYSLESKNEWNDKNISDLFGFSVLPVAAYNGLYGYDDGHYPRAHFWGSSNRSDYNGIQAIQRGFQSSGSFWASWDNKTDGYSIRCIQDL